MWGALRIVDSTNKNKYIYKNKVACFHSLLILSIPSSRVVMWFLGYVQILFFKFGVLGFYSHSHVLMYMRLHGTSFHSLASE